MSNEETIFWKNMTFNEIKKFDEVKVEAEKNFKEFSKALENPQITPQKKDELTRMRDECLGLIVKCVFMKCQFKQKLEELEKKYNR